MTRNTLIATGVVAALASPLAAADQTVEKATRYRATTTEAVSHDFGEPVTLELDPMAEFDEFGAFVWNDSDAQIDELGCCFIWAVNADQVEELGPYYWNVNADQIEELGPYSWNNSTAQVED